MWCVRKKTQVARNRLHHWHYCTRRPEKTVQDRGQKVVNRWALRLCGGLYFRAGGVCHSHLTKIPLTYSVSYFNLWELGALFGGAKPNPRGDGTGLKQFPSCWLESQCISLPFTNKVVCSG